MFALIKNIEVFNYLQKNFKTLDFPYFYSTFGQIEKQFLSNFIEIHHKKLWTLEQLTKFVFDCNVIPDFISEGLGKLKALKIIGSIFDFPKQLILLF